MNCSTTSSVHDALVIAHPAFGVYLGTASTTAHWSRLNPSGTEEAPVFRSAEEAESHFLGGAPRTASFTSLAGLLKTVRLDDPESRVATVRECVRAGLQPWTSDGRPFIYTWNNGNGRQVAGIGQTAAEAMAAAQRDDAVVNPSALSPPTYYWTLLDIAPTAPGLARTMARTCADQEALAASQPAAGRPGTSDVSSEERVEQLDEDSSSDSFRMG